MTKAEAYTILTEHIDWYLAEQTPLPNTEVALLDDFGSWLLQFQDDESDDLQGCAQGD